MARTETPPDAPGLTPRQREVLDLLAKGYTNPQIAGHLEISLDGAKWHVSEVLGRLDVHSREAAANYWRRHQRIDRRVARAITPLAAGWAAKAAAGFAGVVAIGAALFLAFLIINMDGQQVPADGDPSGAGSQSDINGQQSDATAIVVERESWDHRHHDVVMHNLESGERTTLELGEGTTEPSFDGGRVAYVSKEEGQTLLVYDLSGDRVAEVPDIVPPGNTDPEPVANIALSSEGDSVALRTTRMGPDASTWRLYVYSLEESRHVLEITDDDVDGDSNEFGGPSELHWRSDGRGVVVTESGAEDQSRLGGLFTVWLDGTTTRVPGIAQYIPSPDGQWAIRAEPGGDDPRAARRTRGFRLGYNLSSSRARMSSPPLMSPTIYTRPGTGRQIPLNMSSRRRSPLPAMPATSRSRWTAGTRRQPKAT